MPRAGFSAGFSHPSITGVTIGSDSVAVGGCSGSGLIRGNKGLTSRLLLGGFKVDFGWV